MKKKNLFNSLIDFGKKNEDKTLKTIKSFIKYFPDINKLEIKKNRDFIKLIEEMGIPSELDNYFNLIKNQIKEKNLFNEHNFENIFNKIYDYIMEKLNDKIFPKEIVKKDKDIYKNCCINSWIEFSNLEKNNKNYILDSFLPDAIYYFQKLDNEKSPRKKFESLKEIFNCIYNLGEFNENKIDGADDEINLLNFAFIKSKPKNIYTNCRYMNLFLGKKKNQIEGNLLTKLLLLCKTMENFSFKDLYDINETEYIENYDLAEKELLY